MRRGGSRSKGYIARYDAKDSAIMALIGAPWTALAMACKMAAVVKTLVDRPRHVAIVKGLKRNLAGWGQHSSPRTDHTGWLTLPQEYTRSTASLAAGT